MKRILITYATLSGTTVEVARTVSEELVKQGHQATLLPLAQVKSLAGYDAVILGAPMIVGWHKEALSFLKRYQSELAGKPLALFATAMTLIQTGETSLDGVPLTVDGKLAQAPRTAGKLTFKERYAAIPNYAGPMLKAAGPTKPVSLALFGGRLDYYRLKWWAILFVAVMLGVKPGEKRNWELIRSWTGSLF
jgi:menaquinone-dependent protoporphyrinogen oxidase